MKDKWLFVRCALVLALVTQSLDIAFPPASPTAPHRSNLIQRVISQSPLAMLNPMDDMIKIEAATLAFNPPNTSETGIAVATCGDGAKGAWVENIASTAGQTLQLTLNWRTPANTGNYWIDIGKGAGGSEVQIVTNWVLYATAAALSNADSFTFDIPSGTRIATRCAFINTGATPAMTIQVISHQRI